MSDNPYPKFLSLDRQIARIEGQKQLAGEATKALGISRPSVRNIKNDLGPTKKRVLGLMSSTPLYVRP